MFFPTDASPASLKEVLHNLGSRAIPPIHPGETLLEDVMKPLGLSAEAIAEALGVPATRIRQIIAGQRGISADTALRLARYLGTSPEFWLNLQSRY
ncbi:MAG: HigA family addiction module antitoxin, partial [Pseudomonadota bacterium]